MDWETHIVLSAKMLESCGLDKSAAIYSNLPAIDSKPPYFHRVYGHILENQPIILDAALDLFGSKEMEKGDFEGLRNRTLCKVEEFRVQLKDTKIPEKKREIENKIYAYTRIMEEAATFVKLTNQMKELFVDSKIGKISTHKLSAGLSITTHVFFDTFNNPVQAFLPFSSIASAQWDLWDEIDYLRFRSDFYKDKVIISFRKRIIRDKIWDIYLKPEALIKAMIIRVGEQGRPTIPYEAVDIVIRDFLRYLDINEYQRVDREIKFLRELEGKIIKIIFSKFRKKTEF